jgi:hypothetical protein
VRSAGANRVGPHGYRHNELCRFELCGDRQQTTTHSQISRTDKRVSERGSSTSKARALQSARAGECTQITNTETTAWSQINTCTKMTIRVLMSHECLPEPAMKQNVRRAPQQPPLQSRHCFRTNTPTVQISEGREEATGSSQINTAL